MNNFIEHAGLTLIITGLLGGLWNQFQNETYNILLSYGIGLMIGSLIIYLLTNPD